VGSSPGGAPAAASSERDASRKWWALVAICGGTFMLLVDVTIVQVALPRIQRELHASFTNLQWVIDAYALTLSALILTGGTLADRLGRKRVFVGGLGVFTLASLLCGLSGSITFLIVGPRSAGLRRRGDVRHLAGARRAGVPGPERAGAIAAWGATVGGAVAVGPLIGGVAHRRARLAVDLLRQHPDRPRHDRHLADAHGQRARSRRRAARLGGLVTFSGALFLLIFGLLRGNDEGWGSTLIVSVLAGAAVLLCAFLVVELRQPARCSTSRCSANRAFCGVSLATFAVGAGMFAMFPYLTLYLQNALGYSPLQGGLRLLPATVLTFVVPLLTRGLARRPPGALLGAGLASDRAWARADARAHRGLALDRAAPRPSAGRDRHRPRQSGDRQHRPRRRPARAQRHGLRDQQHLSHRRPGRRGGGLGAIFEHRIATSLQKSLGGTQQELAKAVASGGTRAAARHWRTGARASWRLPCAHSQAGSTRSC
jgi:MFS family permease